MKERFECDEIFNSNMRRKNYCYFKKLILYYKHILFIDDNEEVNNCFVNNENENILNCLYFGEKKKSLNIEEKLLFKIYPIKRFIIKEYIYKYQNFFDILCNIFSDLILPIIINEKNNDEDINNDIKEICIIISILSKVNEEFNYLYIFLLNIYINRAFESEENSEFYFSKYYECFNNFNKKIIENPKYKNEYNINVYLSIIMSLNPLDNNLFKKLYTIIKTNSENITTKVLMKIEKNIFNNKLSNNIYTASDVLYNYIIYLYEKDKNDRNCKIFLDYIFIFLRTYKKNNLRFYQQIIELFINKLNNDVKYFNKLCDSIKDKLYLSNIKNISCKQPIEINLIHNGKSIIKNNIYCDQEKQKIDNGPCKITVKDCKLIYKQNFYDNKKLEISSKEVPIHIDKYPYIYKPNIYNNNIIEEENETNNLCQVDIYRNKFKNLNIKDEIIDNSNNLKNFVYMTEAYNYIKNNENSLFIDDISYFKINNEIVFLININRKKYNYLLVKNKYLINEILTNKNIYYKNTYLGKIKEKTIKEDCNLYLYNKNKENIYLEINQNNINDINFTYDNYINFKEEDINNCLDNININPCNNYTKLKNENECCYSEFIKDLDYEQDFEFLRKTTINKKELLYEPLILNIDNIYNNYYILNNCLINKEKFNFDYKIDMTELGYNKNLMIDRLKRDKISLKKKKLNGVDYILKQIEENDTENNKILYHIELEKLFSPNGLYCLKIDISDKIYDKLILKNMRNNRIVWYFKIKKKESTLKYFTLENYDLYLKYENKTEHKITFNNYIGKYKNICKLELTDLGQLRIIEPDGSIIWDRCRIYKKQELVLSNNIISSENGKYLFIIEEIKSIKEEEKLINYKKFNFILKINDSMNEKLYEYSCNIRNNIITYKDIILNCSTNKINNCLDSDYIILNNNGELECINSLLKQKKTIINNSILYNYILDNTERYIKIKEKNSILDNLFLEINIGNGGLGGKFNTKKMINMNDKNIKNYIKHPNKGDNTILELKYKCPYKNKYIDINFEYEIRNIDLQVEKYIMTIKNYNLKNDIIIELKDLNNISISKKALVKFIFIDNEDDIFSISSNNKLPFNIKTNNKFKIYKLDKDITNNFIKHFSNSNNNEFLHNIIKPIVCHGGNIYNLDNICIDKEYYNNYKGNDLIYINNINIDNKPNISNSQSKLIGSGGPGGVIGNSKSNNIVNKIERSFNSGFTKEINLNDNLKVFFNNKENIIQVKSLIKSTRGPTGGSGGYIDMIVHPKNKINGTNASGIGCGGGGGARYIETPNNYFIGNGGNGSKGGAFIITCYNNNNNELEINEILKYGISKGNKNLINLGKIFNVFKNNKKITHIYILLIGGGAGGSIQGYGGNAGNILICSINKNIENILSVYNQCLEYNNVYAKDNYMNIIFNKMYTFEYYNIPFNNNNNNKYVIRNIFYLPDEYYNINFFDSSFTKFINSIENKHIIQFSITTTDNKVILEKTLGQFNYNNKTNSLSILYKNKDNKLFYKFNKDDVDPYQWQIFEKKDECINNITSKNSLYFKYFKSLENIYYNIDNIGFNCENIFNDDKDWNYSNFVHNKTGTIELKYILIECGINVKKNNKNNFEIKEKSNNIILQEEKNNNKIDCLNKKLYNLNIILKIVQFYKNDIYSYKAYIINYDDINISMIINKEILFQKNQEYQIVNIYKLSNNLNMTSISKNDAFIKDHIPLKLNLLYFIDNNNLCKSLNINKEFNSSYYNYKIYSNSIELKKIIKKDKTVFQDIYIRNINNNNNLFKIKILECNSNNIYSVNINSKDIQLSNINLKNDIFEIIEPCNVLLSNNKICCPIPDLSINKSCNLEEEKRFCEFELTTCPNNYITVIDIYSDNKKYFLYYKYNLGNIEKNAIIESTLSNLSNNKTKKVYVDLNIDNISIKNKIIQNNNIYDILKHDKNPVSLVKYLSKKEINKIRVLKTYIENKNLKIEKNELSSNKNINFLEFKENQIELITEEEQEEIILNNKKNKIKEYNKIEYIFDSEPIKLKNIELEIEFQKYIIEKPHTTNFYKDIPIFSFDKKYRNNDEINQTFSNSLILILGCILPEIRETILDNYSKNNKLKLLLKTFIYILSSVNKDCYPKQFINCIQREGGVKTLCDRLDSTNPVNMKQGINNIVNNVGECHKQCEENETCQGGFYRINGDNNKTFKGECYLSKYILNNSEPVDCTTGCISFEKTKENLLCVCKMKDDKTKYTIEKNASITGYDDCNIYCNNNISDSGIHKIGFEYENAKKVLIKELQNYQNAYDFLMIINSINDKVDSKDYVNIIKRAESFLTKINENYDIKKWYYDLSLMKPCETRKILLGILTIEIYKLRTSDEYNIINIEELLKEDKLFEKELVELFTESYEDRLLNLIISYLYSSNSELYINKFFSEFSNYEKKHKMSQILKFKNIIQDTLLLEIQLSNEKNISNILFGAKIKLNEIKELLNILLKMNDLNINFSLNRNIIGYGHNINKIKIKQQFNTININWRILNSKYDFEIYPLINFGIDNKDINNYPQDIWFDEYNYYVSKSEKNKTHIVKEIYEYNYDISNWIKFEKTTTLKDNKILFKCKKENINSKKTNKIIKTVIIYKNISNENYNIDNLYIFKTNKTSNNYYNILGLNVELLFNPEFLLIDTKTNLKNQKTKSNFHLSNINRLLTDFASNDNKISFENRLTILKTFSKNNRDLIINLINNSNNKTNILNKIKKSIHTHLVHYGHNINTLSNEHIKHIYQSYKENYKKNKSNFKLPPNYFKIIDVEKEIIGGNILKKDNFKKNSNISKITFYFNYLLENNNFNIINFINKPIKIAHFKNNIRIFPDKEVIIYPYTLNPSYSGNNYKASSLLNNLSISQDNADGRLDSNTAWRTKVSNIKNINEYWEIKFNSKQEVLGIVTQGHKTINEFVKTYKVKYSIIDKPNDNDFINIEDDYTIFTGNYDNNTKKFNYFEKNIINVKYIRIYPITFNSSNNYISLRCAVLVKPPQNKTNFYGIILNSINNIEINDIITTNLNDNILPNPSNISYYSHIHKSHSHDNINSHLHDSHEHQPTNMIAFIIIKLYYNNNTNIIEFIRQFDNLTKVNIIDFKYMNNYYNIDKIEIIIDKFDKNNCIGCKLNIKQINAFMISNNDDFQLGYVDDKSIKLNRYDTLTINKRVFNKIPFEKIIGGNINKDEYKNKENWCLIDNKCHTNISKLDCITHKKNIDKKEDDIFGYGICPNLVDVWCKSEPNGLCQDIRSSDKDWSYLERTTTIEDAQNNCINKVSDKNFNKEDITGEGLCNNFNKKEGFWCNNMLLNECYDWNTYNNKFTKKNNYEEHIEECKKINNSDDIETGYGTCDINNLEDVFCYDKNNDVCFDKYSEENTFFPIQNRKNNAIQNCLNNYSNLSINEQTTISNRGNCKENKPYARYI